MSEDNQVVTIPADEPEVLVDEVQQEEPTMADVSNLEPEERKLAEEHGIIKELEEKEPSKEEDDAESEEEDIEETPEEKEAAKTYTKHEKDLYRKLKNALKKKHNTEEILRKTDAERDRVLLNAKVSAKKLKEIKDTLQAVSKGEKEITAEELDALVGDVPELPEATSLEADQAKVEYRNIKSQTVELEGAKQFEDFNRIVQMAQQGMTDTDAQRLNKAMDDPSVSAKKVVEIVANIARKNPNFSVDTEDRTTLTKAEKNANRQKTSASMSTVSTSQTVNINDMTPEQASKLPQGEWEKLPERIRKKILGRA